MCREILSESRVRPAIVQYLHNGARYLEAVDESRPVKEGTAAQARTAQSEGGLLNRAGREVLSQRDTNDDDCVCLLVYQERA